MQTVFEVDVTSLRAWREWLELLFPLLILAVLFLARQIRNYAKGRQLRSLAPFLNGQAILRPFAAPRIQGLYMGYPFRLSFFSRGRNSPGRLELQLEAPLDFRLEVRPRRAPVGFGKVLLRGRPVETGDKAFDESVVVRSGREPERAMLYLGNSAHRQTLLQLLHQEGVLLVRFTEKGVLLIKGGDFLGKGAIAPDKVLEYLGYAGRLLGR